MNATIDQIAMLPLYAAAATAILAFLTDLIVPGRRGAVLAVTALGSIGTAAAAWIVGTGHVRGSFCVPAGCSLVADHTSALVGVLFALLTLVVAALSVPVLATGLPAGEYCFLLAASMTGGVALGYSRDLITLLVSLEALTLPLYALVALRRRTAASAEGAMVFFVISVVSSAVTLMGAALLFAVTGALHFGALNAALAGDAAVRSLPLTRAAVVLVLAGLAFKVAAVPFHAWAPATYDGAPTPIAAYLSTASKVGGVIAILYVSVRALGPSLTVAGPILAALAAVTMTVGNLVALRQDRMVRLLAWSSIAQAGYILAPLGALALARGRTPDQVSGAVAATIAYTVFYVVLEVAAFGAVIAVRGGRDGGSLADYRGIARRSPWIAVALVLAFVGLAGLPPGFAGLFAKAVVVRSLVSGGSLWLAVVVGVNAVIGLGYYARVVALFFEPSLGTSPLSALAESARSGRSGLIPTRADSAKASRGRGGGLGGRGGSDRSEVSWERDGSVETLSASGGPRPGEPAEGGSGSGEPAEGGLRSGESPAGWLGSAAGQAGRVSSEELGAGGRVGWSVWVAVGVASVVGLVIGFAPELVLHIANLAASP